MLCIASHPYLGGKSSVTDVALEWTFLSVRSYVDLQSRVTSKHFEANVACRISPGYRIKWKQIRYKFGSVYHIFLIICTLFLCPILHIKSHSIFVI